MKRHVTETKLITGMERFSKGEVEHYVPFVFAIDKRQGHRPHIKHEQRRRFSVSHRMKDHFVHYASNLGSKKDDCRAIIPVR